MSFPTGITNINNMAPELPVQASEDLLSTPQFNSYINQKYVDSDGDPNPSGVHHYEIAQTSGDTSVTIEVPSNTGENVGASIVTNYEYEQRLQDQKRQIRLLDPRYIPSVIEEYKNLMNESSI